MTYEQATSDIAVTEATVGRMAEATLWVSPETGELEAATETIDEIFVTDEGIVGEATADVTIH